MVLRQTSFYPTHYTIPKYIICCEVLEVEFLAWHGRGKVELQHVLNNILLSDEMYCAWRVIVLWADKWNSNFEVFSYYINVFKYVFNIITVFHYLHFHINYNTL